MSEFHDWDDIRDELDDGDSDALAAEWAQIEAWIRSFGDVEGTPTTHTHQASARGRL